MPRSTATFSVALSKIMQVSMILRSKEDQPYMTTLAIRHIFATPLHF